MGYGRPGLGDTLVLDHSLYLNWRADKYIKALARDECDPQAARRCL
jgi:hypothetical protein